MEVTSTSKPTRSKTRLLLAEELLVLASGSPHGPSGLTGAAVAAAACYMRYYYYYYYHHHYY